MPITPGVMGNQGQQLSAAYPGFDPYGLAEFVHAMDRKNGLGQINFYDDNAYDFAS